MLGEKGFNELDMALFKPLIHNQKECCFVRTQCDSHINGIIDELADFNPYMSAETAFQKLQDDFNCYIEREVISKNKMTKKLGRFQDRIISLQPKH